MLQHQLVLQHKIEKLEPSYANAIVQYANIAKPSWISWYAFSAPDEAIQALINEAKSYYTRLPPIQHLPQLPLPQPPSMWFDYESPSLYLEPQFQFGPVINVKIPCKPDNEKHNFGFVTFQNADTVSLLLSKSTSHSICGVEVRVKPYLERTKQEQRYRKLPQKNDYFDNVAHRISCVNAIEGHSGQKLPNFIEPSQEILKHRFEEIDSPLTHNLSEKKKESPEDDHETKESNVDESSELSAM
uniref:Uncharacterized protein n=1 Tax=Oryza punctata TaxID=4537 RepID=A0A0E0LMQ1_ORYPU